MGPDVGWTTGTMIDLQEIMEAWKNKKKAEMKKEREGSKGTKKYSYEASMEARESPLDRKDVFLPRLKEGVKEPQMFHTVTSGAGLYNQWQTRVHYYHFLKMKAECKRQQAADGSLLCEMGGFTRYDTLPTGSKVPIGILILPPFAGYFTLGSQTILWTRCQRWWST